jgi:hypothetical protein
MSVQITTAFVEQYRANVYHLSQQKGSRLRRAVRTETVNGKSAFFEQLGSTSARKRSSRHADTPRMDTPHARRRVTLDDYDWADLVDGEDQVRMLIDPTSQYAEAAAFAMGRAMDDAIIEAADGTAYTGVDGSTSTAYDTNMTVGVQVRWPGVSADDCGLNVAKLLEAGKVLGEKNVDPDDEKYVIVNSRQVKSLLMDTKISSHDYNAIKPLVSGQVVQFAGFNIIPTERIGVDSNGDDKCLYWAKGGMLLGIGKDIMTRIAERGDKNYATQVFACMSIGATRMEEARVGSIICDPDGGPEGNLD